MELTEIEEITGTRPDDNPRHKLNDKQMLFILRADAERGMNVLSNIGFKSKLYAVRWDKPQKPKGNKEYKDWIVEVLEE